MNINQHHDNNKVAQSMIMNYNKHFFTAATIIGILLLPTSEAFTVSIVTVVSPQTQQSVLRYRNYDDDIYQDDIVIDAANGNRRALQLLEQVKEGIPAAETMPRIRRESNSRAVVQSSIIPITNIQDYQTHILHNPNQLCIIRFSAPWCKVCRSTQTAYERLATKVMRLSLKPSSSNDDSSINNKRIQFFTVSLDKNNDNAITKLMHMLQIKKVPQGIIHHPTQCLFGHKVDMNRSNISILKQQLERYLLEDDIKIDAMMMNGKM